MMACSEIRAPGNGANGTKERAQTEARLHSGDSPVEMVQNSQDKAVAFFGATGRGEDTGEVGELKCRIYYGCIFLGLAACLGLLWNNLPHAAQAQMHRSPYDSVALQGGYQFQEIWTIGMVALGLLCALFAIHATVLNRRLRRSVTAVTTELRVRKRAEQEHKKLLCALEQSPTIIEITNSKGVLEYVNPAFSNITGYSSEEAIGNKPSLLNSGKQSIEFYQNLWRTIRGGGVWRGEFCNRKKNGELYWESATISPVYGDDDSITHYIAVKEDITEQRRVLQVLQEREETFRAISESANDAIIMIDHEGRITHWNNAAERIFQYTASEVKGRVLHDFLVPETLRKSHYGAFPMFCATGQGNAIGTTLELPALRKDGAELTVELSLAAVQLQGAWNAVGIVRDITERKLAEIALKNAKEAAESASEAKADFLANMSHEIRTPINGVLGMTGLLLDTVLDPEQREYAERIAKSGDALLTVINDILDFSKVEAGKLDLETIDFDPAVALADIADILGPGVREKGLDYSCHVDPEVPALLRGDPGRLRQVLMNLVSNAIKFTKSGSVRVHVALERETPENATLRFSVTDTGIGIDETGLASVFDAFTQADTSTTRKFGGTGLGLAISRQLVELMGGRIGAESELGRGSTFWFSATFGRQPVGDILGSGGNTELRGKKVLIVEPCDHDRLGIEQHLEFWGCRYETAKCGRAALEKLRRAAKNRDPYDFAILNARLQDMSAAALGKSVGDESALDKVALIMVDSVGMRGDAASAKAAGFEAYLEKPVARSVLRECLSSSIGRGSSEAAGGARELITRHVPSDSRKQNIRILLAEDNRTNQIVARKLLKKLGYRADAVNNGAEAIEALERMHYDLVLMDIQMPELDGYEATRRIRANQTQVPNPSIPIVAMTAHAMEGDRQKCIDAGMDDYVSKPVDCRKLSEALERQLQRMFEGESDAQVESAGAEKPGSKVVSRETCVFDHTDIKEKIGNGRHPSGLALETFLKYAPRQIEQLGLALRREDFDAVWCTAHSLYGTAKNVGAQDVHDLAMKIQRACEAGKLAEAQGVVQRLKQALDDFMGELNHSEYQSNASQWSSTVCMS